MSRQAYLRRARHWIANRGWKGFLLELGYRLRLKWKGQPTPGQENGNTRPHPFDLAHNTDTSGLLWGEELESNKNAAAYWATGYYGISPSAFTAALERLHLPWNDFTFVDVGCGKARAMLLASRFPFRRIVGVELSHQLVSIAQRNVQIFKAPWRHTEVAMEAIQGDATVLPLPQGPLLIFMYHPFAAPVMKHFLLHLQRAFAREKRTICLLYANPELGQMVAETPSMEWMWRETFPLTAEEGDADRFGSHGEVFSAYRMSQH